MRQTRRRFALIALLALLLTATPSSPSIGAALPKGVEVDGQLLAQRKADANTGYTIVFDDRPDLSRAYGMPWRERGEFVVGELRAHAQRTQQRVQRWLVQQDARFKSFWAENAIVVESSSQVAFDGLRAMDEIQGLYALPELVLFDAQQSLAALPAAAPQAPESNLVHIRAPEVWAQGYRGQGIVVASIDTGVHYTHQALVNQYRGKQGSGFNHNYSWWDPYNQTQVPYDSNGHGSHVTGIMLGSPAAGQEIGVAPGARWMACLGLNGSMGSPSKLLECGEFLLAPWDLNKLNPDPSKRPHIINNSWGSCSSSSNSFYQTTIAAWIAAGIYPLFAQGNSSNCNYSSPPGLRTVGNPARHGNVTAVGSSGKSNGQYAPHSNWGPSDRPDQTNPRGYPYLKPQVVAPGVDIRSATNANNSSYALFSGTSMSTPHVAGLVALIWQAAPCLSGNYARSETVLETSARPLPYATGNGDEGPGNVPNHATGWGEINALKAIQQAKMLCGASGTLAGQVTSAGSGQPLAGAAISARNDFMTWQATSDAAGAYSMSLPTGSYTVSAELLGYAPRLDTGVIITQQATKTYQLVLTPLPTTVLSGSVVDGGGQGWPLYARIEVEGYGGSTIYSDPASGVFSTTLYRHKPYTLTVSALAEGYTPQTRLITPSTSASSESFFLMPDSTCLAPGYQLDALYQAGFEADNGEFSVSGKNPSWEWGAPSGTTAAGHSSAR